MQSEEEARRLRPWPLLALTLLCLIPSLFKPPHIDEESYLFIARSILDHPLHPYDWWRPWQPFTAPADTSFIYAHPPLFLWSLSAAGGILGFESIPLLRLSQWGGWLLLVGSVFSLAKPLCRWPVMATWAVVLSPALLLVGHQSLMIDLPTLALMTASVALALPALRRGASPQRSLLAGLIFAAACLTKYPALLLWPLFLWLGLRGARRSLGLLALGWALPFLGWEAWTAHVYGAPHLLYVLSRAGEIARTPIASRSVGALAHLGATLVGAPLLALVLVQHPRRVLGYLVGGGILLGLLLNGGVGPLGWAALAEAAPRGAGGRSLLGIFFALGLGLLGILWEGLRRLGRDRDEGALALWAGVMILGVVLSHNFVGARYLALGAVPLNLLLWRRVEALGGVPRALGLGLSVALALGLAAVDLRWARSWAPLVEAAAAGLPEVRGDVYGGGEWGFRYLSEGRGWRPLEGATPGAGDVIVYAPEASPPALPPGAQRLSRLEGPRVTLRVHAPGAGIGLYSDAFGLLPFGVAEGPVGIVEVWQLPAEGRPPEARGSGAADEDRGSGADTP